LYSCLDAFVVDASDYSGRLIIDTSWMLLKSFPRSGFFNFGNKSKSVGLSPPDVDLFPKLKKPLRGKRVRSIEEVSNEVTLVIRRIRNEGVLTGVQDCPNVGPLW
jgi:hypothetical protein